MTGEARLTWVVVRVRHYKDLERLLLVGVHGIRDMKPLFPNTSILIVKWYLL